MHRDFNTDLLVGSISLACTQTAIALYLGHGLSTAKPAVRALVEDFNQQAIYQRSVTESIARQDYQTSLSTQKDPFKKVPLPDPKPLPPIPRT